MSRRLWSSSSVDAELLGDLLVGGRPVELRLELRDRALDLAGARADGTRHPVHRAQLVDDRALDPRDRVRLELHVAVGVVPLDRTDEAEQAVRDEVVLVDVRRQAARDAAGDELHERRVREDQPVAQRRVTGVAIRAPEGSGVVRHAERIRRLPANSSLTGAPGAKNERRHPGREHAGGDENHPLIGLVGRPGDACHDRRQQQEERAERAALGRLAHAANLAIVTLQPSVDWRRGVAQLAEHRSPKPGVAGSSPAAPV